MNVPNTAAHTSTFVQVLPHDGESSSSLQLHVGVPSFQPNVIKGVPSLSVILLIIHVWFTSQSLTPLREAHVAWHAADSDSLNLPS
jgi:hypothetical protein